MAYIPKILSVSDGNTGKSTLTSHGILYGAGTSPIISTSEPSDGQILIGSTGNPPVLGNITAGANIGVVNSSVGITIGCSPITIVTTFTSSGTWTKNPACKTVQIYIWGGGAGGGSGRISIAGSNRSGGGGGGAATCQAFWSFLSRFSSSETVTIGAGGNGGAAKTTDNTNGSNGGTLGSSSVSSNFITNISIGEGGGGGGGTAGGVGGYFGTLPNLQNLGSRKIFVNNSQNGSTGTALAATNSQILYQSNAVSGGGGGINSSNVVGNGGKAGDIIKIDSTVIIAGGTAGTAGGAGGNGNSVTITPWECVGTSGGGGAASDSANAGAGGNGGGYGTGGGGGGASLNGYNSGAGGNGANGIVIIVEYL